MRINPCHGCPFKKDCGLANEFRDRARNTKARSITYRCDRIKTVLPIGKRIKISHPCMDEDGGGWGPMLGMMAMDATVTGVYDDATFTAVMDRNEHIDEDRFRWRKRMHVRRIVSFLDEPLRDVCKSGRPLLEDGNCDVRSDEGCQCANMKQAESEWPPWR